MSDPMLPGVSGQEPDEEMPECSLCGDPACYGIVQHQMAAVIGAYVIGHRRGDHKTHRPALCRLCAQEA